MDAEDALPYWSGPLCNGYWQIRACLSWQRSRLRKWYRRVAGEKKRLIASGVDPEQIRLLCLYLKNPKLERRWKRYKRYVDYELPRILAERAKEPKQMTLPF